MANVQVVKREVVKVDFGKRSDPQRIAGIIGGIPNAYSPEFDSTCFEPAVFDPKPYRSRVGIAAWPEGVVEREVAIIKLNRYLVGFLALEEFVDELGFDHLDFPFLTCVPSWADESFRKDVWSVSLTSRNSLMHDSNGILGTPFFGCYRNYRWLSSLRVWSEWCSLSSVLVGCK